jgi:HEAT repeat protein
MHGNVWEWCDDRVVDTKNLAHLEKGPSPRVERGGCWHDGNCPTSIRISFPASYRSVNDHGLRVARVPVGKEGQKAPSGIAKTDKAPPEAKPGPDDALAPLVKALRSADRNDRIRAAEKIGASGQKSAQALRALCEATLDADDEVKVAALDALEKVHPALYQPVLTLLVDRDYRKQLEAVEKLARLKEGALPALPLLAAYCTNPKNFHFRAMVRTLHALNAVAPGDPLTLKTATLLAGRRDIPQVHLAGVTVLAELGVSDPAARKTAVAALLTVVGEPNQARFGGHTYLVLEETVLFAVWALAAFGDDAKEALPALKKLKLHEKAAFRTAARGAVLQLEKGGAGPVPYTTELGVRGTDACILYFKKGDHVKVQVTSELKSVFHIQVSALERSSSEESGRKTGPNSFAVDRSGFFKFIITNTARVPDRFEVTISTE